MGFKPGPRESSLYLTHYSIQTRTSTAFATEAAGVVRRVVHISALCSVSFIAVKGKARASYRRVIIMHHIQ